MGQQQLSLFEAVQVHAGTGIVMRDLLQGPQGEASFVVDEAMSQTLRADRTMVCRLLPLSDYRVSSGAGFPASPEAVEAVRRIFLPAFRATEGKAGSLSPEAQQELATAVIGTGFAEGSTAEVGYL